jgi:cyclic beta-1,2-glucan synthetase
MASEVKQSKRWWRLTGPVWPHGNQGVPGEAALGEQYNSQELFRHAGLLAGHGVAEKTGRGNRLLRVLKEHQRVIQEAYQVVSQAAAARRKITPAAVWLLDNDYVLQEHIQLTRAHLPENYSRELPRVTTGGYAGLPRVYELASELVLQVDGRLDVQELGRFVEAFQSVSALKLGELWAVPIMLRLALIGKVRSVATRVAIRQMQHLEAGRWAQRFINLAHDEPKRIVILLAQLIEMQPRLGGPFVAELASRLQGQHAAIGSVLSWLEHELIDRGDSLEALLQRESQEISGNQVSMSNCFSSFRLLGMVDWRDFVEQQSVVERWLRGDPSGTYPGMDFYTRDRYRHVVEDIARRCDLSEAEVARRAGVLAGRAQAGDETPGLMVDGARLRHVGWYLVDQGRCELEMEVGFRPGLGERLRRVGLKFGKGAYGVGVPTLTLVMMGACAWYARSLGATWPVVAGVACLTLLLASQTALSLANWAVTAVIRPKGLPRMDYAKGIPRESATLVVVPNMLSSRAAVEQMVEALEVRYLANREANIKFVLLTDFVDASSETMAEDAGLLDLAAGKIAGLNERYKNPANPNWEFYLMHRPRMWNEGEGKWMGYERKRGKVEAFDRFLLTGDRSVFSRVEPQEAVDGLRGAKYVIVLDADSQLPPGAAAKLAGTMAHPLNKAVVDPKTNRVIRGYGLLQPRVSLSLTHAGKSLYSRMCTLDSGLDPYSREVSDVYQDLYGEGSFVGKGILDVEAFHACTSSRFPENAILSHDLIEGAFARSGLVSDVELLEDAPSRYTADVARRHRWIRGDWQIAQWLLPWCPDQKGGRAANSLGYLSRWKILDNLRRSLLPAAGVGLVCLAMTVLAHPVEWVAIALGFLFAPSLIRSVHVVMATEVRQPVKRIIRRQAIEIMHGVLGLVFMPYEAATALGAVGKVAWRKMVTGKNLLEWQTSAAAEQSARTDLSGVARTMWVCPAAGLGLLTVAGAMGEAWPAALGLGMCWLIAPAAAWWLSRPTLAPSKLLTLEEKEFLRVVARRSWFYFESYVSQATNWLAPDNFQEGPVAKLAERTSPTNIGLGALATLGAWDLGYLTPAGAQIRIQRVLESLAAMERFKGHFLNWYDTRTLAPLEPKYVSTVDSGNLAASLLVLSWGLREMADKPVIPDNWRTGVRDTLRVVEAELDKPGAPAGKGMDWAGAQQVVMKMRAVLNATGSARAVSQTAVGELVKLAAQLPRFPEAGSDLDRWVVSLESQCRDLDEQLKSLPMGPALSDALTEQLTGELTGAGIDKGTVAYFARVAQKVPSLREAALLGERFVGVEGVIKASRVAGLEKWVQGVSEAAAETAASGRARMERIERSAQSAEAMAYMDFAFLYDGKRKQFSIGFHPDQQQMDTSCYDFLASEARIASYVAIAQGQVPVEHWFMLGRRLAWAGGAMALTSWSGSMFEYLMPDLIMPTYPGTLLEESSLGAVKEQMRYAGDRGVPWGISESGYNMVDSQYQYQYKAFGLPTLGFKRGLGEELVIAPYAAVMGVMVLPSEATANLKRMQKMGFLGTAGFYEAVDFTRARVPHGKPFSVVASYMSHHMGMSLLALVSKLEDQPMQRRFMGVPELRAMQALLQERVPMSMPSWKSREVNPGDRDRGEALQEHNDTVETYGGPDPVSPHVTLLGNRRYHVMLTETGGGVSHWQDLALNRWQKDRTVQNAGSVIYVRDVKNKSYWSYACHPTAKRPEYYQATFLQGKAEYVRVDQEIHTHTQVAVSPDDDVEVRRVKVTNLSSQERTLEVTSYVEVVLAKSAQDLAHRAFSNLFVQSELVEPGETLFLTRRARSNEERPAWMFHLMAGPQDKWSKATFETDREKFIGRGRWPSNPKAVEAGGALSNTTGAVLDPVAAIRRTVTLGPGESAELDYVLGAGVDRHAVQALADRYQERRFADRIFEGAWTHSQVVQQQLGIGIADVMVYRRLAAALVFGEPSLRAPAGAQARNQKGQQGLWGHGISGDLPLVFLTVSDMSGVELAGKLIQAHAWWRRKGLKADLVILVEERGGYRQDLMSAVTGLALASIGAPMIDKPGGIAIRNAQNISENDKLLFQAVADVWLTDRSGSLEEQASKYNLPTVWAERFVARKQPDRRWAQGVTLGRSGLQFFNGTGGFTQDGKEYVIRIAQGKVTPAPWANVLANGVFGTVVTESGAGYTWFENAHEYRLTPWHNDPVSDTTGEVMYLRDEETGQFWSPMPGPARGKGDYLCRHGLGYSVYEHQEAGIGSEVTLYVAFDAPVKFYVVKLRNNTDQPKRMTAWACFDWVLGESRHKTQTHVRTRVDGRTGALLATNPYNAEMGAWTAFAGCYGPERSFTGDRAEFYGRNGSRQSPMCLSHTRLSNKVGAGLDPCAGFQCALDIPAGQEREVVFVLGAGHNEREAMETLAKHRGNEGAKRALEAVWRFWDQMLGAVTVETPEPALDVMLNHWVVYQTLVCRMWARSGFYQSGGAYGFRDQLQDAMAMVHTAPWLLREQVITCASRQFKEGDVQHWWHPPGGQGVRTHFSDDYLWLPYATARYVLSTHDTGVLDQEVAFLEGRPVKEEEEAYYERPVISEQRASVYEHCLRALRRARRWGVHGLPLMGCGDWNDGMNRIGAQGKGESVWLAFFLHDAAKQFARVAAMRNDAGVVKECQEIQAHLATHIEANAWDGQWYRRAYFDDGTPVGSAQSEECQIDSIAQSWAVISGAGSKERADIAMQSLSDRLVRDDLKVIQLFTPAFDKTPMDPGYIKGYLPGVRENGAQYTHAAVWAAMAFARQGDKEKLWKAFRFLNPIYHAVSTQEVAKYRVEPYVIAADIYTNPQHPGRGGWTWYTGSAGWFYRLMLEEMLGVTIKADRLSFAPRLPADWSGFKVNYRFRTTMYRVQVNVLGSDTMQVRRVVRDGQAQEGVDLVMVDDGREHHVVVEVG